MRLFGCSQFVVKMVSVLLLVLTITACACVTCYQPHMYTGPIKPQSELAVLYGKIPSSHDDGSFKILRVDKMDVAKRDGAAKVFLSPGEHSVVLRILKGHYRYYPDVTQVFEAGHAYQIRVKMGVSLDNVPEENIYIEDMGTEYVPWNQIFKEPSPRKVYR